MKQRFICLMLGCLFALLAAGAHAHTADGVDIVQAHLEAADDGYRLSASYQFDLTRGLEDAISRGVPLYFTTEVELTRPRWYWFDEKAIRSAQTTRISYNLLTRQYYASTVGGVQQSFATLEDALFLVRRPSRWVVAGKGALKVGEVYNVTLRMSLNLEFLSKPFQVNAINNSDWRLSSDKKFFTYKVEER